MCMLVDLNPIASFVCLFSYPSIYNFTCLLKTDGAIFLFLSGVVIKCQCGVQKMYFVVEYVRLS